ncbi:hypothetical protein HRbin36_01379 [bacterium HR36]|nr:hypothetical protein HRbin36_01379 [bacterium HR36]
MTPAPQIRGDDPLCYLRPLKRTGIIQPNAAIRTLSNHTAAVANVEESQA